MGKIELIEESIELAISSYEKANEKFNTDSIDLSKNDIEVALKNATIIK